MRTNRGIELQPDFQTKMRPLDILPRAVKKLDEWAYE